MTGLRIEYHTALLAAASASEVIMTYYEQGFHADQKQDGSPVTQADINASGVIQSILEKTNIPLTCEEKEKVDYLERKHWEESWCVDPLDGTKDFIKRNDEFAVNIALIRKGKPVFGLIASPTEKRMLFGGTETGVFLASFNDLEDPEKWNELKESDTPNSPLVIACSRSHHSGSVLQLIHSLREDYPEIDFLKKGSSLKFFDLAMGNADIYPRFAPTMEWDIAAGQAILEGLGGTVLHAHSGEPLVYNKENLLNPYFIARTKALSVQGS